MLVKNNIIIDNLIGNVTIKPNSEVSSNKIKINSVYDNVEVKSVNSNLIISSKELDFKSTNIEIMVPRNIVEEIVVDARGKCEIENISDKLKVITKNGSEVIINNIKELKVEAKDDSVLVIKELTNLTLLTEDSSSICVDNRNTTLELQDVVINTNEDSEVRLMTEVINKIDIIAQDNSKLEINSEYIELIEIETEDRSFVEVNAESINCLKAKAINSSDIEIWANVELQHIVKRNAGDIKIL